MYVNRKTLPSLSCKSAESAEPPLHFRSLTLTANFLASAAQISDLPIHTSTQSLHNTLLQSLKSHLHYFPKLSTPLPIKSATPPWLYNLPTIRLDLTNTPKSDKSGYRQLLTEIIAEYPTHIVCFTDGSKSVNKTGYAYSIRNAITSNR